MKKILALLFSCMLLSACNVQNTEGNFMVKNTQWISYDNSAQEPPGFTEISFYKNGAVKFNARSTQEEIIIGKGTYTYLPETKEIFILMNEITFAFVRSWIGEGSGRLPLHEDHDYQNYQMYYKITEYKDNKISVEYCHDQDKIWQKKDGKYKLLDGCEINKESFLITDLTTEE